MARRIDIELTSARDDGTWTWRAAGAQLPKGTLDASVLYPGARVGDVVRAEADFEIDGIHILSVVPPRARQVESDRIEIIGSGAGDEPGVRLIGAGPGGRRRDGERRAPRGARRAGEPRDRDARRGTRDRRERPAGERRERPAEERERAAARRERPARPEPKPKPKRLSPGRAHRDAVLAELAPEQRPIAEQVLKGGIPAVRRAIDAENAKAASEGRPQINADALLALAEELLPRLRDADWRDRAEAAVAQADEIALRDLRAVVTAAETAGRDDEGRALAARLREALERRLDQQRVDWVEEVTRSLDDGRVVRALRISGRPPQPGTRLPAEVTARLTEAANQSLTPQTAPERWIAVLDAVASSPVRRAVAPAGLPAEPGEDLLAAAKNAAPRVPALAALLGIDVPAAPPRRRPAPARPAAKVTPPGAPAKPSIGDSIAPAAATPPEAPASEPAAPTGEAPASEPAVPTGEAPTEPEVPATSGAGADHDAGA